MSSTPQGPGWWQASDGRWYPPQPTTVVVRNDGCLRALGVGAAVVLGLLVLLVVVVALVTLLGGSASNP